MTIQDLGNIGQLLAAIATITTLVYLGVQIRQNTRALRSSTFQDIVAAMSSTTEAISTRPELALLIVKASSGFSELTPEERVRYNFILITTFRRLESVYVQRRLGSIEPQLAEGFERPALSLFFADAAKASSQLRGIHPGFGGPEEIPPTA